MQSAAAVDVSRRKKRCKAVRFLRSIFAAPSASASAPISRRGSHHQAGRPGAGQTEASATIPSAAAELQQQQQRQAPPPPPCQYPHCRLHQQQQQGTNKAWLIEVTVPCCGSCQAAQAAAAAASKLASPPRPGQQQQQQQTPMPPSTPTVEPQLTSPMLPKQRPLQQDSRDASAKLQAGNSTQASLQTLQLHHYPNRHQLVLHQSTPASAATSATSPIAGNRVVSASEEQSPPVVGSGGRLRTSLREIAGSCSTASMRAGHWATRARFRHLAPVPKTLWLRIETASPMAPLTSPITLTAVTAESPMRAGQRETSSMWPLRRPNVVSVTADFRSAAPMMAVTSITTTTSPPLPQRPPPELAKLRAPPIVLRAPHRSMTPSPVRANNSDGAVAVAATAAGGKVIETATASASTQSSGATPSPVRRLRAPSTASAPMITAATLAPAAWTAQTASPVGRVAQAVLMFNSIRSSRVAAFGSNSADCVASRLPPSGSCASRIGLAGVAKAPAAAAAAAAATTAAADNAFVGKGTSASCSLGRASCLRLSNPQHSGPTTADTARKSPDNDKPRPSFSELLSKFEAFERRRRERATAAAAVAAVVTASEAPLSSNSLATTMTDHLYGTSSGPPNQSDADKESVDAAATETVEDACDSAFGEHTSDVTEDGTSSVDSSNAPAGVKTKQKTPPVVTRVRGKLAHSIRIVAFCLLGVFLGHVAFRLIVAFDHQLSGARSQQQQHT